MKDRHKKIVKWKALLEIEEVSERSKGDFVYHLLYTTIGISICTSEKLGNGIVLQQPYLMQGYVNFKKGGSYLVAEKMEKVEIRNYTIRN